MNAMILREIIELTLMMWQAEEVTKMDPGKVAVCLSPILLKRSSSPQFCDFSFMFFEMSEHVEEIFGEIKSEKFFPDDFWNYLSKFDSSMGFGSIQEFADPKEKDVSDELCEAAPSEYFDEVNYDQEEEKCQFEQEEHTHEQEDY